MEDNVQIETVEFKEELYQKNIRNQIITFILGAILSGIGVMIFK